LQGGGGDGQKSPPTPKKEMNFTNRLGGWVIKCSVSSEELGAREGVGSAGRREKGRRKTVYQKPLARFG